MSEFQIVREAGLPEADRLRVFVSYARDDASDFAEYLVVALKLAGFHAYLDRHDIAKAEDWEARIGDLIAKADTVVFILTPASIKSSRCDWEIKRTVALSRRLIPVQWIAVPETGVPVELKRLNYTIFTTGQPFTGPLAEMSETLRQDLPWLRQRTQLHEEAMRWQARGRDRDLLLRGTALSEARNWTSQRKPNAPDNPTILTAFIGSSEDEETARESGERKRLDAMAKALADTAAALEREAEAQQARARARRIITWGSSAAAILIVAGALLFAYLQKLNTSRQLELTIEVEAQKSVVEEFYGRIRLGGTNTHGINAMKKICDEAIAVTSKLGTTTVENEYSLNEGRFWELYYGPMNLIEIRQKADRYIGTNTRLIPSAIESAMVVFGSALEAQTLLATSLPRSSLKSLALNIERECKIYLP